MTEPTVETTAIPGLLVLRLPVHEDGRGWFKEAWQRERMTALGLPDFGPVQANVSHNTRRGTTRGLHAEPWDKLVSLASGRAFGAWVDLREGGSFGAVHTVDLDPSVAVFVPRGVANSYQTLTDDVAYSYLVNDHWRPGIRYPALALDDPTVAIDWPVPLAQAEISEKDRHQNPVLADVEPFWPQRPLILGADGQVGRALRQALPDAVALTRAELDLTDADALEAWPWRDHDVVLNAAAYTKVDEAETEAGRRLCWQVNAVAPAHLARLSGRYRFRLVHYSTDYVYDGTVAEHTEDEPPAPLNTYGAAKAAADLAIEAAAHRPLILRTSWVVGDGPNFVRTMARLADEGVSPAVVDDQIGRLTFADDLAEATLALLDAGATGVVHVSNGGEPASWFDLAREVFAARGRDPGEVAPTSTEAFSKGRSVAVRPRSSVLRHGMLASRGVEVPEQRARLERWVDQRATDGAIGAVAAASEAASGRPAS